MAHDAPIHVLVEVSPKEGEMQTVLAGFAASRDRLKANGDCIRFDIYEHVGTPAKLLVLEVWTDAPAHRREAAEVMASAEFAAFRAKLTEDIRFTYLLDCEDAA